jgi:CheY-like chemotaxis protein
VLRAEGYRVWTAAHAAGAVDLVLTDIAMPGGLGSELAAEIRTSRRWVRVLHMSAYSREELLSGGVPTDHLRAVAVVHGPVYKVSAPAWPMPGFHRATSCLRVG